VNIVRTTIAVLLSIATPMTAVAQPHVIAQLGTAPLIGRIASTPQLREDIRKEARLFELAGAKLGLTPAQYAQALSRINAGQLSYVTIPRHLDAMSWASAGHVYVLHDVVIPANTRGWETDLTTSGQLIALFIPARCGNLSIVRKPLMHVAQAAPAVVAPSPVVAPTPVPSTPSTSQMPAVVLPQAAPATPAPYESAAVAAAPVTHHVRLWPLLLLVPIVALFAGHRGTTHVPAIGTTPKQAPPPVSAPTPPPTGCTPPPN